MRRHFPILLLALFGASAAWPQLLLNPVPSRTVGHPKTPLLEQNSLYSVSPNLVEGRELSAPQGIAVDTSLSPPAIYVADTGNNRVLGWKNAASFTNGQMADIVVGQVDFFTTWAQGPSSAAHAPGQGSPLQSGLNGPVGLAVFNGDLYVADAGNNRVLRYPQPFVNTNEIPNLVIGQPGMSTTAANFGASATTGPVSPYGLSLSGTRPNIAFDSSGNLWMTDPGNRRVLEFAAADVAKSGAGGLTAILEIGQNDFFSLRTNLNPNAGGVNFTANQFAVPSALAFDAAGRLYVADADASYPRNLSRVLVFAPPFSSGMSAARIMGVAQSGLSVTAIDATILADPEAVFFAGGQVGVVDSLDHRVLLFPAFEQWPAASSQVSPQATWVVGHNGDFTNFYPNNAALNATFVPAPSASVFYRPVGAAFANNQVYLTDASNNRVLALPLQAGTFGPATGVLGQYQFDTNSVNLIEGKELQLYWADSSGNLHVDGGLAIDSTGSPPHLYVADTYNNRVLGFKDLRNLSAGASADIVIGQSSGLYGVCNSPTGDANQPTNASLCGPVGLMVDSNGNLWVADRGNGRVLRFPAPFAQTGQPQADLVLGQQSFTGPKVSDATQNTLSAPNSVAMTPKGLLLVSDQNQNRVLVFQPVNGVFSSGQAAGLVLGQTDFRSTVAGSSLSSLSAPHGIAVDSSGRPYVVDTGNNRVLVYDVLDNNLYFPTSAALATFSLTGFSTPESVYVNPTTGEIWVADTSNGYYKRFPTYVTLVTNQATTAQIAAPSYTLAVAQDQWGNLVTADATNRVAFFYPGLTAQNAANNLSALSARALAPGAIASTFPSNAAVAFGATTADCGGQIPLPVTIANIQVLLDGVATPLFMVSPTQINFVVPMGARTSGYSNLQVVNAVTGQVYGAGLVMMGPVSPGLFVNPSTQTGTYRHVAAINYNDSSINGPGHPAIRGTWVELFGTGQGVVAGAPADGDVPTGPVPTSFRPTVYISGVSVDDPYFKECCNADGSNIDHIYYSGLAPGLAGVWQINVKIPVLAGVSFQNFPAGQVPLSVMVNGLNSYDYNQGGYYTTIYIQ